MDKSPQIKTILDTLIYNYTFISDYYKAKCKTNLKNNLLDLICSEVAKISILSLLSILDYRINTYRADDIRVDYSMYSEKTQDKFKKFFDKYKHVRDKNIAHVTNNDVQVDFFLSDFLAIISDIYEADVVISDGGFTPFFEHFLLSCKNVKDYSVSDGGNKNEKI